MQGFVLCGGWPVMLYDAGVRSGVNLAVNLTVDFMMTSSGML